jgi:uncharacterized protein YjiS (DUF1127 family)
MEPTRSAHGRLPEGVLDRFVNRLVNWRKRERLRRELMLLDGPSLADIGIDRGQIRAFVRRAFSGDGPGITGTESGATHDPARRSMPVTRSSC